MTTPLNAKTIKTLDERINQLTKICAGNWFKLHEEDLPSLIRVEDLPKIFTDPLFESLICNCETVEKEDLRYFLE